MGLGFRFYGFGGPRMLDLGIGGMKPWSIVDVIQGFLFGRLEWLRKDQAVEPSEARGLLAFVSSLQRVLNPKP